MIEAAIARRYARAIFNAAVSRQADDAVGDDLRSVVSFLAAQPALAGLLAGPEMNEGEKRALIASILSGRIHPLALELLDLLLEKKRLAALSEIATEYQSLLEARQNVQRAEVMTARPLPPDLAARLVSALAKRTGKRIVLEQRVDPQVLGGAIVRLGDRIVDSSARRRLEEMRQRMLAADVHAWAVSRGEQAGT